MDDKTGDAAKREPGSTTGVSLQASGDRLTARPGLTRRYVVGLAAAAPLLLTPGASRSEAARDEHQGGAAQALEQAFRSAFAGDAAAPDALVQARLAFLAEPARVIDHDVPFAMDRAAYADHMAFRAAAMERYEWMPHDVRIVLHGESGIASAFGMERSKPRHAGFRLRACFATAVCARADGRWQALSLHIAPLLSQVLDASPS